MLILFDIDATLLTTSRAGLRAMESVFRDTLGVEPDPDLWERIPSAGRLDPLIIADVLTLAGRDASPDAIEAYRRAYGASLEQVLTSDPSLTSALPGVLPLLGQLRERHASTHTLGLLTGNFPETGALKLRAAKIDPEWFPVAAWGCDSPHTPPSRDHLPPVAIQRYADETGRRVLPNQVTIIGDTPHDVACARAHACRCLAVATGSFTPDELSAAGADLVAEDLSDVERILSWLTTNP